MAGEATAKKHSSEGLGGIVNGYEGMRAFRHDTTYSTSGSKDIVRLVTRQPTQALAQINLEKRLDMTGFKDKVETMAFQYFGADGYRLTVNGEERNFDQGIERPVVIDLNVTYNAETDGMIEFYLKPNFNRKFGGTLHFIRGVADYVGCDLGYSQPELVKQAVQILPDVTGTDVVYKAVFRFDRQAAEVSFELVSETPVQETPELPDEDFGNIRLYDSRFMAHEEQPLDIEGTGLIE